MIFILTGAGISRESGLETFRDAAGLWNKVRIEDVATIEAFRRNPQKVYEFYNQRRRQLLSIEPNAAHRALAELEKSGQKIFLVTQNVDNLHERSGSTVVLHMHGRLLAAACQECGLSLEWPGDLGGDDKCPGCGGTLRPDVVWFGEKPYYLDEIERAINQCRVFVSIGTSGTVYPAAGLVTRAKANGTRTVELNLEPSRNRSSFDQGFYGPATEVVPVWVESVLAQGNKC
ncbi:MAG: NAD-dependent deacylase [Deltaproteobacteria bacterium]|jgi:NAD-dependent deacetylase|nr:NAD-dependent deacylase [Deltaproteobacteria bacterium]